MNKLPIHILCLTIFIGAHLGFCTQEGRCDEKPKKTNMMNSANRIDMTPDFFKGKLSVQKLIGDDGSMPTYVIRGAETLSIGSSFGGQGVYSVVAADVNNDSEPELVYLCSWGSGLHRSNVGVVEVGKKLIDHKSQEMMLFEDKNLKLQPENGKVVVMAKGKALLEVSLEKNSSGQKKLNLKKLNEIQTDF